MTSLPAKLWKMNCSSWRCVERVHVCMYVCIVCDSVLILYSMCGLCDSVWVCTYVYSALCVMV